jgi:hypothetical protein
MLYRIYTHDRGKERGGVPLYAECCQIEANNPEEALAGHRFASRWGQPTAEAPAKAIEWPPTSKESKIWLANFT